MGRLFIPGTVTDAMAWALPDRRRNRHHAPDHRTRGTWRRYGNTLPARLNERYLAYAASCARAAGQEPGDDAPVRRRGHALVRGALPPDAAARLAGAFDERLRSLPAPSGPEAHLFRGLPRPLDLLDGAVLDALRGPLDGALREAFGCPYRIQWAEASRTFPSDRPSGSWLWHSDNVPDPTWKVILHLTPTGPDEGATALLSRGETQALREVGYFGLTREEHVEDIQAHASAHGLHVEPTRYEAAPGDALLFDNNVFHRAVPPSTRPRDTVTLFLLPNPRPWDEQLASDGVDAVQSDPGGYPLDPRPRRARVRGRTA